MSVLSEYIDANSDKIEDILYSISDKIVRSGFRNYGINNGESGKILFLHNMLKYNFADDYLKYITNTTNNIIGQLFTITRMDLSLSTGLSGFLFVYNNLVKDKLLIPTLKEIKTIHNHMYSAMLELCEQENFDFLSGALGIALYFLEIGEYSYVDSFLNRLKRSSVQNVENSYVYFIGEYYNSKPVVNLGLAHGLSSFLSFISIAKNESQIFEKYDDFALGIAKYLMSWGNCESVGRFPAVIIDNNPINYGRLSWCYGDICVGHALMLYGRAFCNESIYNYSINILNDTTGSDFLKMNGKKDACLCHGTSGLAYIYYSLYDRLKTTEFDRAATFWYKKTVDLYNNHGYSFNLTNNERKVVSEQAFLNGISGVGLSLLKVMSSCSSSWDRILLMK